MVCRVDMIELSRLCDVAADALCAREADRRAGLLTRCSGTFHDGRIGRSLAAYSAAWSAYHACPDDGRSVADVIGVYLANVADALLP